MGKPSDGRAVGGKLFEQTHRLKEIKAERLSPKLFADHRFA
jgi:hypothetical protein